MTATVSPFPSRNPHTDCRLFPCPTCRSKAADEWEARHRHPAGTDLPTPLDYDVEDTADGRIIRLHVTGPSIELDESMLDHLHSAVVADLCIRDGCTAFASSRALDGLCADHRDMADTLRSQR